jgi:hypothetical protein
MDEILWPGWSRIVSHCWLSNNIRKNAVHWRDQNEDGKARSIFKVNVDSS